MANKPKLTGWGIALGAALGTVFGVMAGHVGAWLAIGVAIGTLLGASLRRREPECPQCAALHRSHQARRQA
jgi:H+/Cl- antiporter ClcA